MANKLDSHIRMLSGIKVILFDTFGTIVDWRGSISRIGENIGKKKILNTLTGIVLRARGVRVIVLAF